MEQSELELLYTTYSKELFLYAFSFTKNQHDAEELVSDAFFQLAIQDNQPKNIKFWLFLVVKNRFIDQKRKKKRWQITSLDFFQPKEHKKTDDSLLLSEKNQALYNALDSLKSPNKELILFFYFLDWSTIEIGEFLSLTPNQVRVGLHRSRKQLKEVLKNEN
ncbi:MAG: sigma-70 family RNA polymerase sigma factor [Vagococcus sp.]|uniref:RNA polymerase sigma factor n=1 Tax=Vagococcus sp. TaxID=1933889 RepID=UPI002FCC199D